MTIDEQVAWARSELLRAHPATTAPDGRSPAEVVLLLVDRLEAMLEHTTDMITVLGPEGTIRYSNRAAGLLTGHTEDVNGQDATSFIHPDDVDTALSALAACLASEGGTAQAEFRLRYADGTWHYVEAYAKNCLAEPVAGVVVSMRDVCARKEGEAALLAANTKMREFVAIASHELRTPTTIIGGLASGLARNWNGMDDDERRQSADAIARSAKRLTTLVEDLLTLSAIDAGVEPRSNGTTELAAAVREVIDEQAEREVTLVMTDIMVVSANPEAVHRVLRNYLENAFRYGVPPVSVHVERDGTSAVIRVSDRGPGVDPGFRPHLFERFARSDTARSREAGGTGLGLSIVRALATAWGGEAWYEPGPLGGACFGVRIPLAESAPSTNGADRVSHASKLGGGS